MSNPHIIMRIREELARRRLSRAALAERAKISLSSLEKSLSGKRPLTDQALVRLETALSVSLRDIESPPSFKLAPETLGSYARATVQSLEGDYLTLRPATSNPDAVYTYETRIVWDINPDRLVFLERGRTDKAYSQYGDVSIPYQSGCYYLVTNRHGQYRVAILSRQSITGELYGLLLTLQNEKAAQLVPTAMPMVLVPIGNLPDNPPHGTITAEHPIYAELKERLDKTLRDGFAKML
jgi:transcriptional regulator with XRE-family HTH domain